MGGKVGSVIGLTGGVLAVAGFFLPWMTLVINLEPLGALAGLLQQALFGGSAPAPLSFSGKDFLAMLAGGTQNFLPGASAGAPQPDLGAAAGILTLLAVVVALVLLLSLLTAVFSGVNLATGRLRGGLIGSGAGLLALSVLLLVGLQALIGIIQQGIQQAAVRSAGGGAPAGALGDLGTLLPQVFQFSVSPGIYLCLAGGVLGVAGGVMGRKREKKAAAPVAAAPDAPAAEEKK